MAVSALLLAGRGQHHQNLSATSCPWDLAQFGGVARHVSHWALGVLDGGSGRCFPAGHASAGFAFLGGYFALRHKAPTAARWWLAGAFAGGFVLGAAPAGARRPFHEPYAVDRLAVLDHRLALRPGGHRIAPPLSAATPATPADGSHAWEIDLVLFSGPQCRRRHLAR